MSYQTKFSDQALHSPKGQPKFDGDEMAFVEMSCIRSNDDKELWYSGIKDIMVFTVILKLAFVK